MEITELGNIRNLGRQGLYFYTLRCRVKTKMMWELRGTVREVITDWKEKGL